MFSMSLHTVFYIELMGPIDTPYGDIYLVDIGSGWNYSWKHQTII